jgi:type II secretion system protein N
MYVTFPYDLLAQYGVRHWVPSRIHVKTFGVESLFPPGVQVQRAALSLDGAAGRQEVAQVAGLRIRPSWLALVTGRPGAEFSAAIYGGRIQGHVGRRRSGDGALWEFEVTFAGIEADRHPHARHNGEVFLRGRLSGKVAGQIDERGNLHAASVELRAEELVFAGRALQLPLQRDIACATAESDAQAASPGTGSVSLACTGDDLDIAATGTVTWQGSIRSAQLDWQWQVQSQTLYRQEVAFLGILVGQEPGEEGELSFRMYGPWQRLRTSG